MRVLGGGTTIWLWPRPAVLIGAACIAVVALVLIVLAVRARRRGLPSPVPSGDQEPADGG